MRQNRIRKLAFAVYGLLMLFLLFGRSGYDPTVPYREQLRFSLTPFHTVSLYARLLDSSDPALVRLAVINLVGNVVMFIPLGYFLSALMSRKLWLTLLTAAGLILLVELGQLVTLLGSCDVDDLILNLLGAALGWCLFRSINSQDHRRSRWLALAL